MESFVGNMVRFPLVSFILKGVISILLQRAVSHSIYYMRKLKTVNFP